MTTANHKPPRSGVGLNELLALIHRRMKCEF